VWNSGTTERLFRLFLHLMELTVALNEQASAPVLIQPTPPVAFAIITAV
jgi:hypothetical protein